MQLRLTVCLAVICCIFSTQAYDYYKFSVEIPGAVCQKESCDASDLGNLGPYTLNLHGMWPNANDGSTIENCLANSYDESQFTSTIMSEINDEWVGLYSSSSTFRSHEWGKHGTCWAQQNENPSTRRGFLASGNANVAYYQAMNDYFAKVISVKHSLNLEAALFVEGTAERQISLSDLQAALQSQVGVSTFDLYCSSNILRELRLCLDLDYAPMECPGSPNVQCPTTEMITIIGTIN